MTTVSADVAAHVKEIEKRINDEPGFHVDSIRPYGDVPCHVFFMQVGHIIVMHRCNVTARLPHPEDFIASLRCEYATAFD